MSFLESSKDILYIVIAFCVVWLTIFLCWFVYSLVRILREVNHTMRDARHVLEVLDRFLNFVKDKVEKSSSYLFVIIEIVRQIITSFIQRKKDSPNKTRQRHGSKHKRGE